MNTLIQMNVNAKEYIPRNQNLIRPLYVSLEGNMVRLYFINGREIVISKESARKLNYDLPTLPISKKKRNDTQKSYEPEKIIDEMCKYNQKEEEQMVENIIANIERLLVDDEMVEAKEC